MLKHHYLIQPYPTGKKQKSLAMILPSDIVRSHNINPSTDLLLLRSNGFDDLQIKILREENLNEKAGTGKAIPVDADISL